MKKKKGLAQPYALVILMPAVLLMICLGLSNYNKEIGDEAILQNGFMTTMTILAALYFVTMFDGDHGYMKPIISAAIVSLAMTWTVFNSAPAKFFTIAFFASVMTMITAHFLKDRFEAKTWKIYVFAPVSIILSFGLNVILIFAWELFHILG